MDLYIEAFRQYIRRADKQKKKTKNKKCMYSMKTSVYYHLIHICILIVNVIHFKQKMIQMS